MDALLLVLASGGALLVAYLTYARWLSRRVFELDPDRDTPATTLRDDRDYVPTRRSVVFGHHFTSIAGTGPIVGPAIAVMWGWLPAILWVVVGAIFVGAVHDMGAMVVSLRSRGRSIGDVAGEILGPRVRLLFLTILIVGLWIVLAIFGLVIASVLRTYPAAVTPVLIQVPVAIAIGVLIHRKGRSIVLPSIVALALMYLSVVFGDRGVLHTINTTLAAQPLWAWTLALLAYAYVASVLPVWVLLQPRDYINALQLLTCLALIVAGLVGAAVLGGAPGSGLPDAGTSRPALEIVAPLVNWQPVGAPPLFPLLFITIACGACSGFHCLVGSGTTSKQLTRETDARAVGYGSMLTEGFLATLVIAACAAGIGLGITKSFTDQDAVWVQEAVQKDPMHAQPRAGEPGWKLNEDHPLALERGSISLRQVTTETDDLSGPGTQMVLTGRLAFNKQYESWSAAGSLGAKVGAFVQGAANFLGAIGIPLPIAIALMAVMVASFAATTMDTACRLQRYVIQELARTFVPRRGEGQCFACGYDLSGLQDAQAGDGGKGACPECGSTRRAGGEGSNPRAASVVNPFRYLCGAHGASLFAVVTAAVLAFIPAPGQAWSLDAAGTGGLVLWPLFGATNQLLAGFAFVVITAWLIMRRKPVWFIIPGVLIMLVVPASAMTWQAFIGNESNVSWFAQRNWLLVTIACVTLALEAWLIVESAVQLRRLRSRAPAFTP